MIPEFKNKPNDHLQLRYQTSEGVQNLDYFISRSIAVVGVVIAIVSDCTYVLITKRSNKMRDEKGKLGVPCGYLDWDETGYEAMLREVYEETSLHLPDYDKFNVFDNNKKPFEIKDNPLTDKHQNVSLLYLTVLDFINDCDEFPRQLESFTCHETAMVMWLKLSELYTMAYTENTWAFNHDETIKSAVKFNARNFERK